MRLTHIITDLDTGGAEMMLLNLLPGFNHDNIHAQVISLIGLGVIADKIGALGVPVRSLGMKAGLPDPRGVARLTAWLREDPPDLIQTWMYHSDLIGGLAGKFAGNIPVIWGIRNSTLDKQHSKRSTIWTAKLCARLSYVLPRQIITCSEAARKIHISLGYAANKMAVIPNGFHLETYHPDPAARNSVRQELAIAQDAVLIGLVARYNPQKDHKNFIDAAKLVLKQFPAAHFLLCGSDISWENLELSGWIKQSGASENFHLLNLRSDIPRITAALDVAVSSSAFGEAFPQVIGEAMASGVPCVVTDVGDSAYIVDKTGKAVPARDSQALAYEMISILRCSAAERSRLGQLARKRIEEQFDIRVIVSKYEQLYKDVLRE